MSTLFVSHPSSLEHDTGPGHPERADRIRVLDRAFESEIFQMLHRELAPELDYEALLRVHPADYVARIKLVHVPDNFHSFFWINWHHSIFNYVFSHLID